MRRLQINRFAGGLHTVFLVFPLLLGRRCRYHYTSLYCTTQRWHHRSCTLSADDKNMHRDEMNLS
jgi:hypothetical protein